MIITTNVNIDLQKPTPLVTVNAVQGDQNTRCLEASVYSDGNPWTIPSDAMISMRYSKPDATSGYYDTMPDGTAAWNAQDNVVTMLLAPQMLTVPGVVAAQLEFISGSKILGTFPFLVNVEANLAAGITESENYINWLQWMETELTNRINDMLSNGTFTGPAGPAGAPATLLDTTVTYQAHDNGQTVPTGAWSESIPSVAPGQYLWTRITNRFNTGDPVVSYSVTRMGMDGSGSVSSVAKIFPDVDGNVPLTAENVGALPDTGGNLTGELKMNGQPISGLNEPTQHDHAANKGFVSQLVKKAAPRNLLDNSDFRNPVNQRGHTSYSVGGYTIDRWKTWTADTTVSIVAGGLQITGNLFQLIELTEIDTSKTYTAAIGFADGSTVCTSGKIAEGMSFGSSENIVCFWTAGSTSIGLEIQNKSKVIVWAALYEGEYTAETLPEYQAKGYVAELMECRRYFIKYEDLCILPFVFEGVTTRHYRLVHDVPMRIEHPTSNASELTERKLWDELDSQFNIYDSDKNGVTFSAICEVSDNSSVYAEGTITFSADL